jgi:hypothetical protein
MTKQKGFGQRNVKESKNRLFLFQIRPSKNIHSKQVTHFNNRRSDKIVQFRNGPLKLTVNETVHWILLNLHFYTNLSKQQEMVVQLNEKLVDIND